MVSERPWNSNLTLSLRGPARQRKGLTSLGPCYFDETETGHGVDKRTSQCLSKIKRARQYWALHKCLWGDKQKSNNLKFFKKKKKSNSALVVLLWIQKDLDLSLEIRQRRREAPEAVSFGLESLSSKVAMIKSLPSSLGLSFPLKVKCK